jgi:phage major head subunit gpT-like protein
MSVNVSAASNRIFQEYNLTLLQGFAEAPLVADAYAMEVPSSSRSTLHAWLLNQATVREWLGKRVANSFGTASWEVINRNWELTFEFDVNQIEDDLEGLVASAVMAARDDGMKWAQHRDLLCAQTLEAGFTQNCFDGQFFFDTDHPVDPAGITSGTFQNLFTGAPLTHANFRQAYTQLHKFKKEDGMPMVPPGSQVSLVHPPALSLEAEQILLVKNLTASASYGLFGTGGMSENPLVGKAVPVENAYLTSDTTWYLTVAKGNVKPIMFQRRQAVQVNEIGPGSQLFFDEKKIRIGTDARYEASFTLPQLAIGNKAS